MGVTVPIERCYYYECQNASARLTQFIPAEILQKWITKEKIDPKILDHFPDGVDLDCTDADFKEFSENYQYVHPFTAEQIQNTFFAIFSTTKNWKKYRGSGLIHARELENNIEVVEKDVVDKVKLKYKGRIVAPKTIFQKNTITVNLDRQQKDLIKQLIAIPIKQIDTSKPIHQQRLSKIKMSKGENPEKIFMALNQRKNPKT